MRIGDGAAAPVAATSGRCPWCSRIGAHDRIVGKNAARLHHIFVGVGQRIEGTSGDPQTAAVITLLVSPEDAQKLTLATSEGRIQLSLRNLVDSEPQNLESVRNTALYRGATPLPDSTPKVHVAKAKPAPLIPVVPYSIEVIRGHDVTTTKF